MDGQTDRFATKRPTMLLQERRAAKIRMSQSRLSDFDRFMSYDSYSDNLVLRKRPKLTKKTSV